MNIFASPLRDVILVIFGALFTAGLFGVQQKQKFLVWSGAVGLCIIILYLTGLLIHSWEAVPVTEAKAFFTEKITGATEFTVVFGSNTIVFPFSQLEEGIPFNRIIAPSENTVPMRFYVIDGHLKVDMTLFDDNNETAVKMVENEFEVNARNWDRNFNDVSLEIVDENLVPRMQIIRTKPFTIQINGVFYLEGGTVWAGPNGTVLRPANDEWQKVVPRRFKYPSVDYEGELEEQ